MKGKILLVDDEESLVSALKLNFIREGYEVWEAYNGTQALQLARKKDPEVIILDLLLPDIDGLEVCREIRKNSDVPVIILSAKNEELDKVVALEMGVDRLFLQTIQHP